jgi:hypothetical protein
MNLVFTDQFVACCPPIRPTANGADPVLLPGFLVITVGPAGAPAGTYTITLVGIVLGGAQLPTRQISVSTTSDLPSAQVNSVRIGGVVQVILLDVLLLFRADFFVRRMSVSPEYQMQIVFLCLQTRLSSSRSPLRYWIIYAYAALWHCSECSVT